MFNFHSKSNHSLSYLQDPLSYYNVYMICKRDIITPKCKEDILYRNQTREKCNEKLPEVVESVCNVKDLTLI